MSSSGPSSARDSYWSAHRRMITKPDSQTPSLEVSPPPQPSPVVPPGWYPIASNPNDRAYWDDQGYWNGRIWTARHAWDGSQWIEVPISGVSTFASAMSLPASASVPPPIAPAPSRMFAASPAHNKVGQLTWSIRTAGTVSASPERVMTWWMHPDRMQDLQDQIERTGIDGFSQTESTEDGIRVRAARWRDRRGWLHESRFEAPLDSDGRLRPSEDGSFPLYERSTLRAPHGYEIDFTCVGRIEFNRQDTNSTEIIVIHNHRVVGGTWFNRRRIMRSDLESEPRDFQDWVERCQAGLTPSVPQESD